MDEKIILKLKKIKALAEKGTEGEKDAAAAIYKKLLFQLDVAPEELNYIMSESDHIELLETINEHPGKVLISGYDNQLYNKILPPPGGIKQLLKHKVKADLRE